MRSRTTRCASCAWRVGDRVTLFTGAGGEFAATLVRADKRDAVARIDGFDPVERESALAVTLVQGIAANDAMDHAVRRAVELGAAAIQPVLTTRSARAARRRARRKAPRALAPDRRRGVRAMRTQSDSRRARCRDARSLARRTVRDDTGVRSVSRADASLADAPRPRAALDMLVGPEGGLASEEVAQAARAGLKPVRLGPRVLRTETAALASLAAINAMWGDFRG